MRSRFDQNRKYIRVSLWAALLLLLLVGSSIIFIATIQGSANGAPRVQQSHPGTPASGSHTPAPTATVSADETPTIDMTPTPLFNEDFLDNSKGWPITDSPDFTRTLEDNKLTLSVINHNILTETVPSGTTFGDCTVNITFTLLKADGNDSAGVYIRGDGLLFHDYRIDIFGNNTVALSKEYLDANRKPQTLEFEKTPRVAALAPVGRPNTLTIMMKGPYILVQINGTTIKTMVDSDYPRGQIALFVNNGPTSGGATATFSHVEVTADPEQLPGLPLSPTVTVVAVKNE